MAKQELYEYQYTTPNKQVVKAFLPALKKPKGRSGPNKKVTWGIIFQLIGIVGFITMPQMVADGAGVFSLLSKMIVHGILLVAGIIQVRQGREGLNRLERYFRYMRVFEGRPYASIEELASTVAKKPKTVMKDLEYMMDEGWFLEAHLDTKQNYFMLTNQAYQQFNEAEKSKRLREKEEQEKQARENDPAAKELDRILEEGKEYIREIRRLNDEIAGEEVSNKLYAIEDVVGSIFEQVKRKPEKMTDIRKFMQYYLPMTVKVVRTYRDFENENLPSAQLEESKKEIEETLDKVQAAFVKLREKLFAEDVLDVSTDLDVLETMMSQEGLISDEFK
ncbi:MAG: 5-bromo-4-chloroindolyl phosphate hydrolysis family protein [Lachnospiraceae bacterium]|nr:5-bromo-4-chloroindolyl phosphate hydrolysis family protein [Lachnospiraceae bacterium]